MNIVPLRPICPTCGRRLIEVEGLCTICWTVAQPWVLVHDTQEEGSDGENPEP